MTLHEKANKISLARLKKSSTPENAQTTTNTDSCKKLNFPSPSQLPQRLDQSSKKLAMISAQQTRKRPAIKQAGPKQKKTKQQHTPSLVDHDIDTTKNEKWYFVNGILPMPTNQISAIQNIDFSKKYITGYLTVDGVDHKVIKLDPNHADCLRKMQKKRRIWCYHQANYKIDKVADNDINSIRILSTEIDGFQQGQLKDLIVKYHTLEVFHSLTETPWATHAFYAKVKSEHKREDKKFLTPELKAQYATIFQKRNSTLTTEPQKEDKLYDSLFLTGDEICFTSRS